MGICPKCKKEIDYLNNNVSGQNKYIFDGDDYEFDEFIFDYKINEFECPNCHEVLTSDENEARRILQGE